MPRPFSTFCVVLVCALLFVLCASPLVSARPLSSLQSDAADDASASVDDASSGLSRSGSTAILGSGEWRHESLHARTLLATSSAATVAAGHKPDDQRHGLSTQKAQTAHYATLRLDNTWQSSSSYCVSVGASLCKLSDICPNGAGHAAIGASEIPSNRRSWAPIGDKEDSWVNMEPGPYAGKAARCVTAANTSWGKVKKALRDINSDWANHSKSLVACCDAKGVMKSTLRSSAKYPGTSAADESYGRISALPRYTIRATSLGESNAGVWRDVRGKLRGQAEWIWNTRKALKGVPKQHSPLHFQKRHTIDGGKSIKANCHYAIDDHASVRFNGEKVSSGHSGWGPKRKPHQFAVTFSPGMNVLDFACKNGGGPAGLIAACWTTSGAKLFSTDSSWSTDRSTAHTSIERQSASDERKAKAKARKAKAEQARRAKVAAKKRHAAARIARMYTSRHRVYVLGGSQVGPWGGVRSPLRHHAHWIWNSPRGRSGVPRNGRPLKFQYKYNSPRDQNARMYFVIDDHGTLTVNGKRVGSGGGGWANRPLRQLTFHLKKGVNVIEFACRNGGGPAGLIAAAWAHGHRIFYSTSSWRVDRHTG